MYFAWALAATGLILVFLEFFLPGAIMAIGGGILLLASLFFYHMVDPRPFSMLTYSLTLLASTLLVIRIALWKIKASKKIISEGSQEGFQAVVYPKELIGKTGVAQTDLKPSGFVWIEDGSFEALSKSGYIDKGTKVQILSGQGAHLLVKSIDDIKS